jgi:hypothetical protein
VIRTAERSEKINIIYATWNLLFATMNDVGITRLFE